MAVAVVRLGSDRDAVLPEGAIDRGGQLGMIEVDAGVEDRDPRAVAAEPGLVGAGGATEPIGADPLDPERKRLGQLRAGCRPGPMRPAGCAPSAAAACADPWNWNPFRAWV